MSTDTTETEKAKPVPPPTEWVLTSEDDFRGALPKMMKYRGLIMQHLAAKMAGRNLFSAFIRGSQKHIRADSFFDAILAMELEVVVRPPQTKKGQRRIEGLRAEALAHRAKVARELAETLAEQAEEAQIVADEALAAEATPQS
jgi:hypothetical protein